MGSHSIRRPNPFLSDSVFEMFRLDGKVVIITGGAGGIGYQVARGLAEAGANIALWYCGSPNAIKLASELQKDFGIKAKAYKCSVQNFDEVCGHTPQHLSRTRANFWIQRFKQRQKP